MVSINPEMIKGIASKAGAAFNKIMASGKIPEGSIFDAASKLGINNTDDLKGAFEKVKQNPAETIGNALNSLHEQGFKLGEFYSDKNTEAAGQANASQTPQAAENQVSPLEQVTKTLKSAGLDLKDSDVQKNIAELAANPDKLKDFIAKKIGIQAPVPNPGMGIDA